jgi:hypothetical protein
MDRHPPPTGNSVRARYATQLAYQIDGGTRGTPLATPIAIMHGYFRLALPPILIATLLDSPGMAAPFCVQSQAVPPQCLYVDAPSCDAAAKRMGGYCSINKQELHIAGGIGHFCVVTSALVSSCVYPDEASCDVDAQRQHGVCVAEPTHAESPAPDPYRAIRPLSVGAGARD